MKICLHFRRLRSSSFLFILAINDVLFLVDLLPGWISTIFLRTFYHNANLICKIQTYVSFVASFVHIWLVLAFTAERFFAVNFPLKHMSQCIPRLSRVIILLIVIPAIFFYIYPAFFATEIDKYGHCREKESHLHLLNLINLIDTILTMILPFILVLVLNLLIIRKLFCSNAFRKYTFDNGITYQYRRTSNWTQAEANRRKPLSRHQSIPKQIFTELRLTKMLLTISLTCLSLNFPWYYSRLIIFYNPNRDLNLTFWTFYKDILFHYMSYLSYAINILIYFLFGTHFRRVFKRVFLPTKQITSARLKLRAAQVDNDTWSMDCSIADLTGTSNDPRRLYTKSRESLLQQKFRLK